MYLRTAGTPGRQKPLALRLSGATAWICPSNAFHRNRIAKYPILPRSRYGSAKHDLHPSHWQQDVPEHGASREGWQKTPIDFIPMAKTTYPQDPLGPDALINPAPRLWPATDTVPFHYPHPVTGDLDQTARRRQGRESRT